MVATFRTVLVIHLVAILAQAAIAGEFLSGTDSVVKFHLWVGWTVLAVGLVQTAAAGWVARGDTRMFGTLILSVLVALIEALQVGTGIGRFLRVHIPLGVTVFGIVAAQTIAAFRAAVHPRVHERRADS